MPQAQHTVTINRPVDAVFAFVADGEKCPQWRPGVLDIKRVSGDGGVGTRYAQGVSGRSSLSTTTTLVSGESCLSRIAAASPAGPAPTITTSNSMASRAGNSSVLIAPPTGDPVAAGCRGVAQGPRIYPRSCRPIPRRRGNQAVPSGMRRIDP